jgi:hypothetical protein
MNKYLILFLLVSSIQSYSQTDNPPGDFIYDEISKFFYAEVKSMGLEKPVDIKNFEFREKLLQPGRYINDSRQQWLSVYTICDIKGEYGRMFGCMDFLFVIFRGVNKWESSVIRSTCSVFQFTEDLNNDGYNEIATANGFCNMGECVENYKIFLFKDLKESIVYSYNDGKDLSGMHDLKKGDTVLVNYKISFEDKDNDKVKELIEDKTIGIIDGFDKDGNYITTATNIITRYLYTGSVFKKFK